METLETTDTSLKEARTRPVKTIAFVCRLPVTDHAVLSNLTLKRMKQLGEDIPRDTIISEAIQFYAKAQHSQE